MDVEDVEEDVWILDNCVNISHNIPKPNNIVICRWYGIVVGEVIDVVPLIVHKDVKICVYILSTCNDTIVDGVEVLVGIINGNNNKYCIDNSIN